MSDSGLVAQGYFLHVPALTLEGRNSPINVSLLTFVPFLFHLQVAKHGLANRTNGVQGPVSLSMAIQTLPPHLIPLLQPKYQP